jgi:hypothetical protein
MTATQSRPTFIPISSRLIAVTFPATRTKSLTMTMSVIKRVEERKERYHLRSSYHRCYYGLYECETRSLSEEYKLREFQNMELRRMF